MKKLLFVAITLVVTVNLLAQDIIVTNDAKKIEAKILEVSKSEIRYKEHSNPDGPTFVLSTSEISSIIYSNGKVTVYNNEINDEANKVKVAMQQVVPQNTSATDVADNSILIELTSGEIISAQLNNVSNSGISYIQDGVLYTIPASKLKTVTFANGQVKTYNDLDFGSGLSSNNTSKTTIAYVSRSGNTYYYNGRAMDESTYYEFLQNNCAEAFNLFREGNNIAFAGWCLFSVGLGIDLGTLIGALITGVKGGSVTYLSIIGSACEIACIPTLCVGYAKKHRSADVYNATCAGKNLTQTYWSINASQNGIGIAFNF